MTDKQRILARLQHGPVSPVDFAAPNVCDGGKPIMRVAGRINDLRNAGYEIVTLRKRGNGVALYTLLQSSQASDRTQPEKDTTVEATPEMARPTGVPAVRQNPAALSAPAAVASSPSCDAVLPDSPLFDSDEFRESTPHWRAA